MLFCTLCVKGALRKIAATAKSDVKNAMVKPIRGARNLNKTIPRPSTITAKTVMAIARDMISWISKSL